MQNNTLNGNEYIKKMYGYHKQLSSLIDQIFATHTEHKDPYKSIMPPTDKSREKSLEWELSENERIIKSFIPGLDMIKSLITDEVGELVDAQEL